MNDRDQARAELAALLGDYSMDPGPLDTVLAHPDLVLRALGMEQVKHFETNEALMFMYGKRVWVEPPTDKGGAET